MKKRALGVGLALLLGVVAAVAGQGGLSDDAGRVLALETAWNHAIETKDTKAMDMLLSDSMVAVESDGELFHEERISGGIQSCGFPAVASRE